MDRKLSIAELAFVVGAFALALGSLRLFLYLVRRPIPALRPVYYADAAVAFLGPLALVASVLAIRRTPRPDMLCHPTTIVGAPILVGMICTFPLAALLSITHTYSGRTAAEEIFRGWTLFASYMLGGFVVLGMSGKRHWPKDRLEWSGWVLALCWITLLVLPRLL